MINTKEPLEMQYNIISQTAHIKSLSSKLAFQSLVHFYFSHHSL